MASASSYQCTLCASTDIAVLRADTTNPRLKCNSCKFVFDGQDSRAAMEAGVIKPSSPESLASASEPERSKIEPASAKRNIEVQLETNTTVTIRPSYVFLSKPRGEIEFASKQTFKKTAIKWSDKKFDLYELKKISLNVKVDIS